MFEKGWKAMTCRHWSLTPADQHGYAICTLCGSTIPVALTPYQLDRAMQAILKRGF